MSAVIFSQKVTQFWEHPSMERFIHVTHPSS